MTQWCRAARQFSSFECTCKKNILLKLQGFSFLFLVSPLNISSHHRNVDISYGFIAIYLYLLFFDESQSCDVLRYEFP